jgi:ribonuclease PH
VPSYDIWSHQQGLGVRRDEVKRGPRKTGDRKKKKKDKGEKNEVQRVK